MSQTVGPADEEVDPLELDLRRQRAAFLRDGPPTAAVRRARIDELLSLVVDNADDFATAMRSDYGTRSHTASLLSEVVGMVPDVEYIRANISRWMRPRRIARGARLAGLKAEVRPEPLGVVGIIAPWNFPLNLAVLPAVSAFAAGNRVMIKMSEVTPRTAELFESLVSKRFNREELIVVTGGVPVAERFSALPFDHLFFTGSSDVGRRVQRAAAENLVPVTLELGGKNPVVVDQNANIGRAAERIAKARLVNGGQVCVCPDYVFVPSEHVDSFVDDVVSTYRQLYPRIVDNDQYCSSVDTRNYDRVVALVDDARRLGAIVTEVTPGAERLPDKGTRKIAPTVLTNVTSDMQISRHEVFGPVLTVYPYREVDETIDYVNSQPSPLVAYWYGPASADFDAFSRRTRSGGLARNDFGVHTLLPTAPFGGVGNSGMGTYHGKSGFDTFTHHKTIVGTDLPFSITGVGTPPFSKSLERAIARSIALHAMVLRRRNRRSV